MKQKLTLLLILVLLAGGAYTANAGFLDWLFPQLSTKLGATFCYPQDGCVGTNSIPNTGDVLVGQSDGTYEPQATSTLGFGAGGDVATDSIWDAKGDVAGGTGADTAAVLSVGTDGQVLTASSSAANGLAWSTVAGSGDVSKVGTPVDNEIGVWTGDGTIEGDSNFTWNGTGLTATGTLTVSGTSTLSTTTIASLDVTAAFNADTATALASNGANCSAGEIALGVDASGAVEGCYEPAEADISDLNHTATAITDGLIIEPDLDADNAPTDNDILTYDSTGTNFFWQTPAELSLQSQGDVLDDLNTLGAASSDGEFIVATGAGAFAYESGATARTSLGLAIGTNVQAWDAVLDDLSALSVVADNEFIVGTGAGTYANESGATALTSLENGAINILQESEIDASSELAALMDDETGSGVLVFGTDPTFTTQITLTPESAPTTDADGEIAVDIDAWATGRDAIEFFDSTASTYLVGVLASDSPSDGQVLKWNTGGTITWEDESAGGSSEWTDTGSIVHPNEETVDEIAIGGTTEVGADIFLGVDGAAVFNDQSNDVDFRIEGNGDANVFYVDAGNDRVGIGTSTPSTELQVIGTATADNVKFGDGTLASPALAPTSVASSGFYVASGELRLGVNGGNLIQYEGGVTRFVDQVSIDDVMRLAAGTVGSPVLQFTNCTNCGIFYDSGNSDLEFSIAGVSEAQLDAAGLTITNNLTADDIITNAIDASGAVDMDYGSADITDHTFTADGGVLIIDGSVQFPDADGSPSVAGELQYDNTVTGIDDGAIVWYDDDAVRYLVDLATLPSDDDYVVAYDAVADGFYMKADATGAGTVSFGADNQIPYTNASTDDFDYSSDFTFDGTDLVVSSTVFYVEADEAQVGIGTSSPSRILHVQGEQSGGIALFERTPSTASNAAYGTFNIQATHDGNMGDGFGSALQFYISDSGATETIANVQAVRDGADNTGELRLVAVNAGSPVVGLAVNGDGSIFLDNGPLFIAEQADADGDVAGYGQLWVDTATPNVLYFTDDAGNDRLLVHTAGDYTWTGAHDYGGATSLEIPNGTAPTLNATGEIGLDTTDGQLRIYDGTADRVYGSDHFEYVNVTVASSSAAYTNGGFLPLPPTRDGFELTEFHCYVTNGTSTIVNITDASNNDTEQITCATTLTSDTDVATNDTITAGELMRLEFATTTGAVDYLSFSAYGRITVE